MKAIIDPLFKDIRCCDECIITSTFLLFLCLREPTEKKKAEKVGRPEPPQPPRVRRPWSVKLESAWLRRKKKKNFMIPGNKQEDESPPNKQCSILSDRQWGEPPQSTKEPICVSYTVFHDPVGRSSERILSDDRPTGSWYWSTGKVNESERARARESFY